MSLPDQRLKFVALGFQPPLFSDFGKLSKDLGKKKFDAENSLIVKNRTADADIETSIIAATDAPLRGVFKSEMKLKNLGAFNGVFGTEFHTVANKESKTSYKLVNLYKGLGVKATLVGIKPDVKTSTPDFPEGWLAVETTYTQEYVSAKATVRTNSAKTLVDGEIALGYDNVSVGGKVTVDTASKAAPNNYDFGTEYNGGNYLATLITENKRGGLKASFHQKLNRLQSVGAEATFGLIKPGRTLTIASDYRIDVDTSARAKVKVDSSKDSTQVGFALEHRISDFNTQIGVAVDYTISPAAISAGKYGLSFTIGDL